VVGGFAGRGLASGGTLDGDAVGPTVVVVHPDVTTTPVTVLVTGEPAVGVVVEVAERGAVVLGSVGLGATRTWTDGFAECWAHRGCVILIRPITPTVTISSDPTTQTRNFTTTRA
jgi:hypothetical protein